MRHGIDLKTHSQCQRSGQIPQITDTGRTGSELVSLTGVFLASPQRQAADDFLVLPTANRRQGSGGAYRDRTDDPLLAKQVLSQLS